jgi:DNA-binding PadR family transcriptional regulator
MRLPDLSHLQFVVLACLTQQRTGREIRDQLKQFRVRQSGPAFYQMMARLERGGLVKGWYTQQVVEGQIIKERQYRITAAGGRACEECRRFYAESQAASGEESLAQA